MSAESSNRGFKLEDIEMKCHRRKGMLEIVRFDHFQQAEKKANKLITNKLYS